MLFAFTAYIKLCTMYCKFISSVQLSNMELIIGYMHAKVESTEAICFYFKTTATKDLLTDKHKYNLNEHRICVYTQYLLN